jgi:hypothetical protein
LDTEEVRAGTDGEDEEPWAGVEGEADGRGTEVSEDWAPPWTGVELDGEVWLELVRLRSRS